MTLAVLDSPVLSGFTGFPQQEDFIVSDARFVFAGAAVRTGKTYGAGRAFHRRFLRDYELLPNDALTYWCIAPTFELTVVMKAVLFGDGVNAPLIPEWMIDWQRQGNDRQYADLKRGGGKVCLIGGRTIAFKTADKPESLVADKVRGVWWTEIARSKYKAWPNVRSRLSNYPDSWLIADTSPMGRCWFYVELWDKAIRGELADAECFQWGAVDSPFVPREEIEAARRSLPPEFFRRDYEASWATFTGQIFSGFDRKVHMLDHCPFRSERQWVFADLNQTNDNPACWVEVNEGPEYSTQTFTTSRIHVTRENQAHFGHDLEGYADAIQESYRRIRASGIVVDPSMPREFKLILERRGLKWLLGKNPLMRGIRVVGMHLHTQLPEGARALTMSKTCANLASEFEGWSWKTNPQGVVTETPDKDALDPHRLDALRYGIMSLRNDMGAGVGYARGS